MCEARPGLMLRLAPCHSRRFIWGAALAVKAVAPRHFSFLTFGVTQVVIDSEAAFYILSPNPPKVMGAGVDTKDDG